ncbi:GerMN domain-containing protein [Actinomadura kijaniata]|uniref:GerMN domain-containing protein n=1 Tax=Actinomadura kijaniata TaxID=46161 RepID=UPI000836E0BE|nr:GerMN domain-containing protein [Actinomadura kijaniata]
MKAGAVLVVLVTVLSACGIRPTGTIIAGGPPLADREHPPNTLYLVRDGRLVPVRRPGVEDDRLLAFHQLRSGPTEEERNRGMTSAVPEDLKVGFAETGVRVDASGERPLPRPALAQLACTATALPGVKAIEVADGTPDPPTYTCADFHDLR